MTHKSPMASCLLTIFVTNFRVEKGEERGEHESRKEGLTYT